MILDHLLYVPSVAQLNDPAYCGTKIKPLTEKEMVTFLRNDYIRRNPVVALDLLPIPVMAARLEERLAQPSSPMLSPSKSNIERTNFAFSTAFATPAAKNSERLPSQSVKALAAKWLRQW